MKNEKKIQFRKIYKIALSISIILSGVCLISGCAIIYFSGNGYSAQIVANMFSKLWICIPIYLSLILIVADIVWELIEPSEIRKFNTKKIEKNSKDKTLPNKKIRIIKIVIMVVAIISILFGVINGGYTDVFTKAAKICQECIGLG